MTDSEKSETPIKYPWKNGLFQCNINGKFFGRSRIEGMDFRFEGLGITFDDEHHSKIDVTLGKFETGDKRGLSKTGLESYEVKLTFRGIKGLEIYANVIDDGKTFVTGSGDTWDYMDEEALEKLENEKDPWDDYSHFYDHHPEKQGKVVWISGGTGMGKTTTSENLMKKHGFVFYEGDAFFFGCNPYSGNSPEGPSLWNTKHLRGIPKERIDLGNALMKSYSKLFAGEEYDIKVMIDAYNDLCDDIQKEKAKIGGNWVVPQAVYLRVCRDFIRHKLRNHQVVFILLDMTEELQIQRLAERLLGTRGEVTEEAIEKAKETYKTLQGTGGYERKGKDEENCYTIEIDGSMDVDSVTNLVLEYAKL